MKTKIPFASRCIWLCALVCTASCYLTYRLVAMQVEDVDNRRGMAADELIEVETIPAQRGIIMDRNEEILTNNITGAELLADRTHLRDFSLVVDGLAYNQALRDPRWAAAADKSARNKIVREWVNRLTKNAELDMTLEEREAARAKIDPKDTKALFMMDYDPAVCEEYYSLHDKLVAEVLWPFLANVEVRDTEDEAEARPDPQPAKTKGKGKGRQVQAPPPAPKRYMTKEDIIEKIAQNKTIAANKEAEARGEAPKRLQVSIKLARGLNIDTAEKIRRALAEAHIRGVVVQTTQRRSYVTPNLLSHVLGYVDHENKGVSGVESVFNSYLAGCDGLREYRHNARGQVLSDLNDRYLPPKHGLNLRLTIDMRIQSILEQELDNGLRFFHARRGCMIAVNPKTGDILGMVSRPAFDLNTKEIITHNGRFKRGELKDRAGNVIGGDFNFACQARYEPGSTFKSITVSTAVDTGVFGINSVVSAAPYVVAGAKAVTDSPRNYGALSLAGGLKKSSNPVNARVAITCGWKRFKEYMDRFGVTQPTGIPLPSGGACQVSDGTNPVNLSRMAYGYAISVSPLHMAMVYSTIANKGVRMAPRLIDKIITAEGEVYDECPPQVVCRVMKEKTASDVLGALESVTQRTGPGGQGTATRAAIPGFRIAGKTGTAKKLGAHRLYTDNLYTVSFAGILPVNDPKLVIMTVIDEPHPTNCNAGGGTVAAPIFRAAALRIIELLNIQPSNAEEYEKFRNEQRSEQAAQAEQTKKQNKHA